uniref:Uncharacterized protein n=1 Tax=Arundo donax TaxID=35708 RepID=A0A0A9GVB7_ARUDO
MPRLGAWGRGF